MDERNQYQAYALAFCKRAKKQLEELAVLSGEKRNALIRAIGKAISRHTADLLKANAVDMEAAIQAGVSTHMQDRLLLTEKRLADICDAMEQIADLPDPLGKGDCFTRPNGLMISRKQVPLGVVAVIYEARPNVTFDTAALCLKSGNATILRGGKEALQTNLCAVSVIHEALAEMGLSPDSVQLFDRTEREYATALMEMRGMVDLLIPRGGKGLIRSVVENAKVPVIETGAGNCHIFVDASADVDMAVAVTVNAKLSRPAVCNAAETLLVHKDLADAFLPAFAAATADKLEMRGCPAACAILPQIKPAEQADWETEYDDAILAVKVVDSVDEAIDHINTYSTGHSEAILTNSLENSALFRERINSACVYVNASTRFTDGGEFGFGAEIGISTQKLHIRGPMGPDTLTTVKYTIEGNGQTR